MIAAAKPVDDGARVAITYELADLPSTPFWQGQEDESGSILAIPTLTGATVLQLYKHRDAITANDLQLIAVGALVSFVVALAVVKAFMAVVTRHGFAPFAWYRIIAGAGALVWLYGR